MKRLSYLLPALVALFCSCKQDDTVLPDQQKRIESYLTGSHPPPLVSEQQLEADSQLPFYSTSGNTVYRYISDFYDPDRVNRPLVTESSVITITFYLHVFNYATIPSTQLPFYTNDVTLEQAYYAPEVGLTPGEWVFEPLTVEMANPGIINGLYGALLGCRQGDEVEAYMTYNMAFGDQNLSVVPKNSPIACFFTINTVE